MTNGQNSYIINVVSYENTGGAHEEIFNRNEG